MTVHSSSASPLPALFLPSPDDAVSSAQYWGWLRRHELRIQHCESCDTFRCPVTEFCHVCQSSRAAWVELRPEGSIYSWTRVWHPVHEAYVGHVPYLLAWVEINHPSGARILGNVVGDPLAEVQFGDRVVGVFEDRENGTILNWRRDPA